MKAGTLVEVRSKAEILSTLDSTGRLDGLPFMPQMLAYCGKRFRVYKVAHKTCDSFIVNETIQYHGREMHDTVLLENLRCDGAAYGGCNAACMIFWRTAWLKLPDELPQYQHISGADCTEEDILANTTGPLATYRCQATDLEGATLPLSRWNLRQYVKDWTSGNTKLGTMATGFFFLGYDRLCNAGLKLGKPLRFLYDAVQGLYGGIPYPKRPGTFPVGKATPVETKNLQPGEWVKVKSHKEILATMDKYNRNRGMYFTPDQVPYCGRTFRVAKRVNQIIDERSGRMVKMKTPCIVLEGAVCRSRYTDFCLFCPRATYPYWREIWLDRVPAPATLPTTTQHNQTTPIS